MENNKKSFVLHLDSLDCLNYLNDNEIANLFKAMRNYNLGLDYELENQLMAVFISFKNQFDRDSEKYNTIVERNQLNGAKGGRPSKVLNKKEPKKPNGFIEKPKIADNDNDSNTDSDKENDILLKKETKENVFSFKKSLINHGFQEKLIDDWLRVRKTKKATNSKTAFDLFIKQVEKSNKDPNQILELCIAKDWKGFQAEWINNLENQNNNSGGTNTAQGYKPASVDSEKLVREFTNDFENGNIPGQY